MSLLFRPALERYLAQEAGFRLRRKLERENPKVFLYGGLVREGESFVLTVTACSPLNSVPEEWQGYLVQYSFFELEE